MVKEEIEANVVQPLTRRGFGRLAVATLLATGIGSESLALVAAREAEPGDDHGSGGGGQDDPPGDDHGGRDGSSDDDRRQRRRQRRRHR